MNTILKCSRVLGSLLALLGLGGLWVYYAHLVAGFGGIARSFHESPHFFTQQFLAMWLPYSLLLLLIALPFSRIASPALWRVAFGLLVGFSFYWFVFMLATSQFVDLPLFLFSCAYLLIQALSVWLQRHPPAPIATAMA